MSEPADKQFSATSFLEDIKTLVSLKQFINPEDVRKMMQEIIQRKTADDGEKELIRGYRRLIKELETRSFFMKQKK